jgi:hypothetical protein
MITFLRFSFSIAVSIVRAPHETHMDVENFQPFFIDFFMLLSISIEIFESLILSLKRNIFPFFGIRKKVSREGIHQIQKIFHLIHVTYNWMELKAEFYEKRRNS